MWHDVPAVQYMLRAYWINGLKFQHEWFYHINNLVTFCRLNRGLWIRRFTTLTLAASSVDLIAFTGRLKGMRGQNWWRVKEHWFTLVCASECDFLVRQCSSGFDTGGDSVLRYPLIVLVQFFDWTSLVLFVPAHGSVALPANHFIGESFAGAVGAL